MQDPTNSTNFGEGLDPIAQTPVLIVSVPILSTIPTAPDVDFPPMIASVRDRLLKLSMERLVQLSAS